MEKALYKLNILLLLLLSPERVTDIIFEVESDACQTPDGQLGECIDIFQCEKILNLIKCPANLIGDYVRRSTCGFLRYNPKVSRRT
jgi:Regulatory CLIP domain of proteinases